jgi:hypothetical protein
MKAEYLAGSNRGKGWSFRGAFFAAGCREKCREGDPKRLHEKQQRDAALAAIRSRSTMGVWWDGVFSGHSR